MKQIYGFASLLIIGILLVNLIHIMYTKNSKIYTTNYNFFDFNIKKLETTNNATFVTCCNHNYVEGVMKLYKSMQKVGSKYPLLCFCTSSVTEAQKKQLIKLGIKIISVDIASIYNPYKPFWTEAFIKLSSWQLTQYSKVCWIDADTIMLQNCDELLMIPLKKDGIAVAVNYEIFATKYNKVKFNMLQSGVIVLTPCNLMYAKIQSQLGLLPSADGGDQGFLTSFFSMNNFKSVIFLCSKYNYSKRGLKRHKLYDITKIKILHFVGHPKPWLGGEPGYEVLQAVWNNI